MEIPGLRDISWSSIPTDVLLAELTKRQQQDEAGGDGGDSGSGSGSGSHERPACGTRDRGAYDTPLHVFALFLILFLSTVACGFPLFSSRRTSKSRRTNYIIFLCQHFGTGVLIATAFVHLLPTAFMSLTDPCLPYTFSKGYKPMAGVIAMASTLVVVVLESYLTTRGAGHSHSHNHEWDPDDGASEGHEDDPAKALANGSLAARRDHRPTSIVMDDLGDTQGLMADVSPLPTSIPRIVEPVNGNKAFAPGKGGQRDSDDEDNEDDDLVMDMEELDPIGSDEAQSLARPHDRNEVTSTRRHSEPVVPQAPITPEEQKRQMLQCLLLEAGILFHSVFIGMAVSVATGPPFVVFLIAIAFHQTFEGLALGSRIAAISFPRRSVRPWLMVLAYGTTTPIGQAIGLGVHTMYDPRSQTGLLMVGFMNAISSGLLLFAGLVQLLAEDFLTEKSYKSLKGKQRRHAGLAVLTGAGLMALVGAFA